ncbi:hypothetical protein AC481_02160 [miscellaneous Crenarchaeota group archaeon SMTZ-80]|nr:MAG: hypothetical protein AC481_02160 [miscellaneous Crenarchaeota group archaeon SMTZ-80]
MSLTEYLKRNNIWHRFIDKSETVHTADAAKASGVPLERLTKNLVSKTDEGEYIMIIVPGDKKVDLKTVAKLLEIKKVRLMPFEKAEDISGYPPGGTPSVGHKMKMRTVMERSLLNYETIYCGGGSRDRILELKSQDVVKINNAILGDISQ